MLSGGAVELARHEQVIELRFQAAVHGYKTDDLVCTLQDDTGASRRALLQVKRDVRAVASDDNFGDALIAAWLDFHNPACLTRDRDRVYLVYRPQAEARWKPLGCLTGARRVWWWAGCTTACRSLTSSCAPAGRSGWWPTVYALPHGHRAYFDRSGRFCDLAGATQVRTPATLVAVGRCAAFATGGGQVGRHFQTKRGIYDDYMARRPRQRCES